MIESLSLTSLKSLSLTLRYTVLGPCTSRNVQFLVVLNGSQEVQEPLSFLNLISVAPVAVIVNVTFVEDV